MEKYEAIEEGIANNDIRALRRAIGNICYTSRDFSSGEFDDVVKYVESEGIHLKEDKLVGELISKQKAPDQFTDRDFSDAVFELKMNFCEERIQDVKTIGKKLCASKPDSVSQPTKSKNKSSNNKGESYLKNQQSHQQKSNVPVIAGLVAVIVVISIVVMLMERSKTGIDQETTRNETMMDQETARSETMMDQESTLIIL